MSVFVLGLDVGFATFGWALVELLAEGERVEAMGVITTKKSNAKQNVLASSDDHRRAYELVEELDVCMPGGMRVSVVCAEAPSMPRNASAANKIGRAWGIVDAYVYHRGIALVQASPQQIKKAVCGNAKKPTKEDVQRSLSLRFAEFTVNAYGEDDCGDCRAIDRFVVETPKDLHNHAFDALGAVVACLDSEVIRAIRPRWQGNKIAESIGMGYERVREPLPHEQPRMRTHFYCQRCGKVTHGDEGDHECTPECPEARALSDVIDAHNEARQLRPPGPLVKGGVS